MKGLSGGQSRNSPCPEFMRVQSSVLISKPSPRSQHFVLAYSPWQSLLLPEPHPPANIWLPVKKSKKKIFQTIMALNWSEGPMYRVLETSFRLRLRLRLVLRKLMECAIFTAFYIFWTNLPSHSIVSPLPPIIQLHDPELVARQKPHGSLLCLELRSVAPQSPTWIEFWQCLVRSLKGSVQPQVVSHSSQVAHSII